MAKKCGTVLIVEDDPNSREMLSNLLSLDGIPNVSAASAEEALEIAAERPIAVAIIDILLPGIDGYALLSELQCRRLLAEGKALTLTALYCDEEQVRARNAGFAGCLGKPIRPKQLIPLVNELLSV